MKRCCYAAICVLYGLFVRGGAVKDSGDVQARSRRRSLREGDDNVKRSKRVDSNDMDSKYLTACIKRYPGYNGRLEVTGHVKVIFIGEESDNEFQFEYDMRGVEDHCKHCRIHIAEGTTCEEHTEVGGHYWDESDDAPDPWTKANGAFYQSNNNGKAIGEFNIDNGYDRANNRGHAVVVYAIDGRKRIGCGVLKYDDRGLCGPGDKRKKSTPASKQTEPTEPTKKSKSPSKSKPSGGKGKGSKGAKSSKKTKSSKSGKSSKSSKKTNRSRSRSRKSHSSSSAKKTKRFRGRELKEMRLDGKEKEGANIGLKSSWGHSYNPRQGSRKRREF